MRDGNDRAFIFAQVVLQPGHRFGVQVVGGLVQQQDIRLGQQQPGESHAPAFAAGKHLDWRIRRRAAQGIHGQFQVAVQVPGVDFVECLLQAGLFDNQCVEVCLCFPKFGVDLVEMLQQIHNGLDAFTDYLDDGLLRVELRLLLEQANAVTLAHADLAGVILILAGHDAQKGGLASPVQAEHADLGAVIKAQ